MNRNPSNYKVTKNTWCGQDTNERFFVAYAVEGPMEVPQLGLRAELPVDHPIPGPVHEPSPLNTRYLYNPPDQPIVNIL